MDLDSFQIVKVILKSPRIEPLGLFHVNSVLLSPGGGTVRSCHPPASALNSNSQLEGFRSLRMFLARRSGLHIQPLLYL
jgi:hypothetical protein